MHQKTAEQTLAETMGVPYTISQIHIGNFHINYLTAGEGPPLLLIHGMNFGWGMWHKNIPDLVKNFRVYAVDLPGAGGSTRVNYGTLDFERDFVDTMKEFLHRLDLMGCVIIGHSIGGWVAARLSFTLPDMIQKIILVNSVGFLDSQTRIERLLSRYIFARALSGTVLSPWKRNPLLKKMLKGAFVKSHIPLYPEFFNYIFDTIRTSPYLCLMSRIIADSPRLSLLPPMPPSLAPKTLVLWGSHDAILPYHRVKKQIEQSGLPVEIFSDAGHVPHMEAPERFARIAHTFFSLPV